MSASPAVQRFFEEYERSRNTFDPALVESLYADVFMFAGPAGARATEKPAVLSSLPKGRAFLETLGHTTTKLTFLQDTTLDEHYAMVHARFVWRFEKASAEPIDVEVDTTFVLFRKDDVLKIVFQQEREDFQEALRARGVLPARP